MKATLVRDVIETAYPGDRSVRRTEVIEVWIDWPTNIEPPTSYETVGEWRIAIPVKQRVGP